MAITLDISVSQGVPVATTLDTPYTGPVPIQVEQGKTVFLPVNNVLDQYGQPMASWTLSSSNTAIVKVAKVSGGINIVGVDKGSCQLVIS
jgi:hypothetical protein